MTENIPSSDSETNILPPRNFIAPPDTYIRDLYKTDVTPINDEKNSWRKVHVAIYRKEEHGNTVVFEYDRNYAMYKTFEPFRQLKDGVWKDYALISTDYTRFEVVDLEKGEIIAVEPYPEIKQEWIDDLAKRHDGVLPKWAEEEEWAVGTPKPGWGFCPVEFRVYDWSETLKSDDVNKTMIDYHTKELRYVYSDERLNAHTGQWALYSGCHWGDDSGGWKLRYIDLSRISEGIVTSDERFGYIQLAGNLQDIYYYHDGDKITIPVELTANVNTGLAYPIEANWNDKTEDDEEED